MSSETEGKGEEEKVLKSINYRIDTMKLIELFANWKGADEGEVVKWVTPSRYAEEMLMRAEARLELLKRPWKGGSSCGLFNSPQGFAVMPPLIVFQNFLPGRLYTAQLTIRNTKNVLNSLRPLFRSCKVFKAGYISKAVSRLAPGMCVNLFIEFSPEEKKDLQYNILFQSDDEEFVVPVFGFGPRQLIDFPNEIHFNPCLVKGETSKVITLRNIGEVTAVANLKCSEPFHVEPEKIRLLEDGTAHLEFTFKPSKLGTFNATLAINYETGETVETILLAESRPGNIFFKPPTMELNSSYIGLKEFSNLTLHNTTSETISFQWRKYRSIEDDLKHLEKLKEFRVDHMERKKLEVVKVAEGNIAEPETHKLICDRILTTEEESISIKDLGFKDDIFEIIPSEGRVPPNSQLEFRIGFSPQKAELYQREAFLEATGVEGRLSLPLTGVGKGPDLRLNVGSVNFDHIFLGEKHSYELVVHNNCDIPGEIAFQSCGSLGFLRSLSCEPGLLRLEPREYGILTVTLSGQNLGPFVEEASFMILQSNRELKCIFIGKIVAPMLKFEPESINFGQVSLGLPLIKMVRLRNSSRVAVPFSLSILQHDTTAYALTCWQYLNLIDTDSALPDSPQEIFIWPQSGIVEAHGHFTLMVHLLFNHSF